MTDNKLLIIAWDGLDHELVNEFDIQLHEDRLDIQGKIDNDTGVHTRSTSELFTTFITGEYHDKHGVTGLNKYNTRGELLEKLFPKHERYYKPVKSKIYNFLMHHTKADKRKYRKEDYKTETMFEEVKHSEAMFVPGYEPGHAWEANLKAHTLDELSHREDPIDATKQTIEMIFRKRLRLFEERISEDTPEYVLPDLLMVQFHYPDHIQHIHGVKELGLDKEILEKVYDRVERESQRLRELAESHGYEVMFMSDHGLPKKHHHNKNAMFSVSGNFASKINLSEEFEEAEPRIGDWKEKILDYVGQQS